MLRPHLPLNALRAFEASARHLSFTRAAIELCVTQAAVSHQVKSLEAQLNVTLFKRLPRGLMLTSEGETLLPVLRECFDRIAQTLGRFEGGHYREVLTVGAVGTFAVGWLLPRLEDFQARHPYVDLRLSTNNNRVDVAAEGLDYAIRFGTGAWHGIEALALLQAPLSVLCVPELARQLHSPADLLGQTLLRSYRTDEWPQWFQAAGLGANSLLPHERGLRLVPGHARSGAARPGRGPGAALDVPAPVGQWRGGAALRHRHCHRQLLADPPAIPGRNPGHGRVQGLAAGSGGRLAINSANAPVSRPTGRRASGNARQPSDSSAPAPSESPRQWAAAVAAGEDGPGPPRSLPGWCQARWQ